MASFADRVRAEARLALPYGILLTLALGLAVSVGAHQSNAFPSQSRPFGWEGPAHFNNAVAMVRGDLMLAASLPALLLGAVALRGRDPRVDRAARAVAPAFLGHAGILALACFLAGAIGGMVAFRTPTQSYFAFSVAHALLALGFYSLAFLCGVLFRRFAVPAAMGVWVVFNVVYERVVQTVLFRTEGYHNLAAGNFPAWFYVAQALSPLSAYRGVLILWERGFMDYLEKAALGQAALPGWVNPGTFAGLMLVLWVALPMCLASFAWWWQGRSHAGAPASRVAPEGPI